MQYPMRTGVGPDNLQITSPKVMKYIKMKGIAGTDPKILPKKIKDMQEDDDEQKYEKLKATLSKSRDSSHSSLKKAETMTSGLRNKEMLKNYFQNNKERLTIQELSPT